MTLWRIVLAIKSAEGVWNLEVEGDDRDDPPGSRRFPVSSRFVDAPATFVGELAGHLTWTISRVRGVGVAARTTRFELDVRGDAYAVLLSFRGPGVRLRPGFVADGVVRFHDRSRAWNVQFEKGLDEEVWLRYSGPHRTSLL